MALNGMAISCAAASSGISSGTGMTPAALAMKLSAQVPWTPAALTRRPTMAASTPSPTASIVPTASEPPIAGSGGL